MAGLSRQHVRLLFKVSARQDSQHSHPISWDVVFTFSTTTVQAALLPVGAYENLHSKFSLCSPPHREEAHTPSCSHTHLFTGNVRASRVSGI